jgi:hypothetical protein
MTMTVRGVLCDGVWLTLRRGSDYTGLMKRVAAIANIYEVPAGQNVSSINEDDKNCAIYHIELDATVPKWIAKEFSKEVRDVFRDFDGYNYLTIGHRGVQLLADGPWWESDLYHYSEPTA